MAIIPTSAISRLELAFSVVALSGSPLASRTGLPSASRQVVSTSSDSASEIAQALWLTPARIAAKPTKTAIRTNATRK